MPGLASVVSELTPVPTHEIVAMVKGGTFPRGGGTLEIVNEVRPADLFCYLGGRFGPPNGMQNFLRSDDSDNLIHWEWTLQHSNGIVTFQGMNFRTDVHFHGSFDVLSSDRDELVSALKADFARYGKSMGEVRNRLENWIEFVNPYQRLRRAIEQLLIELDSLGLDPAMDPIEDRWWVADQEQYQKRWEDAGARYARAFGLAFGVRSMIPVLAESFVNLVLFVLMRQELKTDNRLRENILRQPIDVRIRSLAINCIGFKRLPDYTCDACAKYHSLVNERNDLLHGNVAIEKLRFNEVYFLGTVPVFKEYRTMWQRSVNVKMEAVGLLRVRKELEVVDALIEYLCDLMEPEVKEVIEQISSRYELGLNAASGRIGVLFGDRVGDVRMGVGDTASEGDPVAGE